MEKRLGWMYIMSLLLALTAIGVQGYWLYNQFRYETELYAGELAKKVLSAGEDELRIRKKSAFARNMSYVIDHSTEVATNDSVFKKKSSAGLRFQMDDIVAPSLTDSMRVTGLHLSFDSALPEDSVVHGVERGVINYFQPFREELLDSMLHVSLPHYTFEYLPLQVGDTLSHISSYKLQTSRLFEPSLCVTYRYSPLEKKGIRIIMTLPVNPLLERMGWQLGASLFLIVLLLVCLCFLITTILKQKKISEIREGFVHTMVHELRRPVQTLKMCISFLKDSEMRKDDAMSSEVLQDAMFELDNLSGYLSKLRDMVSTDGGVTLLHAVPFNLRELVEKVIRLTKSPADKKVSFFTAFPPDLASVVADPVHMANILSNLIENSIKYSLGEVEIRIVVISDKKRIELTVSDNGFGISPGEQHRVFDKFFRSVYLRDKQIPGLGLGLSYVRQIAEAHRGSVSLRSEVGKGTTVTVLIPQ